MTTQKKYICAFCARAFTRSEHKQRHERSHTNEKPFHCMHCTSSFVRRDLLQRHCRTVHNSQMASAANGAQPKTEAASSGPAPAPPLAPAPAQIQVAQAAASAHSGPNQVQTFQHNQGQNQVHDQSQMIQNQNQNQNQIQNPNYLHNNQDSTPMLNSSSIALTIFNGLGSTASNSSEDNINDIEPLSIDNRNDLSPTLHNSHHHNSGLVPNAKRRKKTHEKNVDDIVTLSTANGIVSNGNGNSAKDGLNHDLIHLLSIAKKLESLLISYDISNESNSLNDHFLIGYINLQQALGNYPIFDKMLKDLIYYLNSYNSNKSNSPTLRQLSLGIHSPIPGSQPNNFKIGIIYSVISMGYITNNNYNKSFKYFKMAWYLLIKKLIPNYNNNNNLLDQIEILNNLYLLSYIYLNYNLEAFSASTDDEEDSAFVNNEIILNYLNDISYIIISNLKDLNNSNENLIDLNINLFWNIYILLSQYLQGQPPKFYSFFLNKSVKGKETLRTLMLKFSKSLVELDYDEDFLKMIIISTLSNELKKFVKGDNFLIFNNKNCLHNSIILINKSINIHNTSRQLHNVDFSLMKLFELFKKSVIISSPLKFHELLSNYIFIPQLYYNWELLNLTLQEINLNYPINQTLQDFFVNPAASNLEIRLKNFFNYKQNSIDINNNLSIISFPIVFFTNYLNLGLINIKEFNFLQLNNLNLFLVEWYLIMNKILLMIWSNNDLFNENYILQNLIFLLMDNKSCLSNTLNLDMPSPTNTSPRMSSASLVSNSNSNSNMALSAAAAIVNSEISYHENFAFNNKWFWIVKMKFDTIFESWLDFIRETSNRKYAPTSNTTSTNLALLRVTLDKFINDLDQSELAKSTKEDKIILSHEVFYPPPAANASITPTTANAPNPMVTYNYPEYNTSNYRRSNSITLGILGNSHTRGEGQYQSQSPIIANSSATNGVVPSNNNPKFKVAINGNNKMNHYSSYSTYPPLPPILATPGMSMNGNGTNASPSNPKPNASDMLLLPPILPKSGSFSNKISEDEQANTQSNDSKSMQTLVSNIVHKD